ncbi:MAG: hypothetical protein FWD93_02925 [Coriobacteriia bacterium]|nr:hypothetical protein [Coriobacteriia bacterium]
MEEEQQINNKEDTVPHKQVVAVSSKERQAAIQKRLQRDKEEHVKGLSLDVQQVGLQKNTMCRQILKRK